MRLRRKLGWAVVTGFVIVAAAFLASPGGGPRYKGRSLQRWLVIYGRSKDEVRRGQAADAIRQIGTNAIPYLLANIRYETPNWMQRVTAVTAHLPGPVYAWWEAKVDQRDRCNQAYDGFFILGSEAVSAVPRLLALADSRYLGDRPTRVLAFVGTAALPYLVAALTNVDNPAYMRSSAVDALGYMGAEARSAAGVLVNCLDDTGVEANVAWAVSLVADRQTALRALTNALTNPSSRLRFQAASAIANLGDDALAAIPLLTACLEDKDADVRRCATYALSVMKAGYH